MTDPTDLDILMAHVHEINAKTNATDITDNDIAILTAYHRHNRARRAAGGGKTRKPTAPTVDVLGLLGAEPKPEVKRLPGLRRI